MESLKYRRVLLKISGEGLCKPGMPGIDGTELARIANEIKMVYDLGAEVCVTVGAGNLIRGSQIAKTSPIEEVTGHYMGMLGTVINALAVQDTMESMGVPTRVQSAISIDRVCERFIRRRSIRHLEKGRVVIFAAGTGNPYFSTDSGAALRASECHCHVLMKATKVDGIYSDDPVSNPTATLYDHLSYSDVINRRLKVIDVTAVDLCRTNNIPIVVFNLKKEGNMRRVVMGETIGTLVDHGKN